MISRRAKGGVQSREGVAASDADIMRRLAAGESSALGELYDRYHEALRCFIAGATSDAPDVDDLLHATFLAAAKSAPNYDGRLSCRPWLVGIAVHYVRRRRQTFGRFLKVLSALCGAAASSFDPRPALQARGEVERALGLLSEPKRLAFLMAEVEGLSCPEIAATLGIPIGTVWTRLHAARRELRQALQDGNEP